MDEIQKTKWEENARDHERLMEAMTKIFQRQEKIESVQYLHTKILIGIGGFLAGVGLINLKTIASLLS